MDKTEATNDVVTKLRWLAGEDKYVNMRGDARILEDAAREIEHLRNENARLNAQTIPVLPKDHAGGASQQACSLAARPTRADSTGVNHG